PLKVPVILVPSCLKSACTGNSPTPSMLSTMSHLPVASVVDPGAAARAAGGRAAGGGGAGAPHRRGGRAGSRACSSTFRRKRERPEVAKLDFAGHRVGVDLAVDSELQAGALDVEVGRDGHNAGRERAGDRGRAHRARQIAGQFVAVLLEGQRAGVRTLWRING